MEWCWDGRRAEEDVDDIGAIVRKKALDDDLYDVLYDDLYDELYTFLAAQKS